MSCFVSCLEEHSQEWLCHKNQMTFYRRNLPHWHPEDKAIFLTWRLFGSLPAALLRAIRAGGANPQGTAILGCATDPHKNATEHSPGKRFELMDAALDRGSFGPLWLSDPEIAAYAEYPILRGAELGRYVLHAYVIMPNHVHLLLEPHVPLAKITGVLKGVAARDANATLGRIGKHFWQDESFDHWIRNSAEFERFRHYIEWNPVNAGLAAKPEDWEWSSARGKLITV
jgi:putative transposase